MMSRMVVTHRVRIDTSGQNDARDVTPDVLRLMEKSGLSAGVATVSVIGSTAGVTTIEFEPGAVSDVNAVFEGLAPRNGQYRHHLQWGDDNGSSHVRAALLGPSVSIPFDEGRLLLGTWQQVTLFEFDTRPRSREIVIQFIGE